MRREDLRNLMGRQPCPPLRLHMTNGRIFDIDDPDLVVLGRSTVELMVPAENSEPREAIINLLHIIWIEVLPTKS